MSKIVYQLDEQEFKEYQQLKRKKEEGNIGVSYLKLAIEDLLTFGLYDFQGSIEELRVYEDIYTKEEVLKLLDDRKQGRLRNIRTIFYSKNFVVQKDIKSGGVNSRLIITNKNTKEIIYV